MPSSTDALIVVAPALEAALTARALGRTAAAGAAVPVEILPPSLCAAKDPYLPTNRDAGSTVWWARLWSRLGLREQGGGEI